MEEREGVCESSGLLKIVEERQFGVGEMKSEGHTSTHKSSPIIQITLMIAT